MIVYLACPYSSRVPAVREFRFATANKVAAWVMSLGHVVFSPISHSHPISEHLPAGLLMNHEFWMAQDLPLLALADELWVYCGLGWEKSKGVRREVEEAKALGKPVRYVQPEEVR